MSLISRTQEKASRMAQAAAPTNPKAALVRRSAHRVPGNSLAAISHAGSRKRVDRTYNSENSNVTKTHKKYFSTVIRQPGHSVSLVGRSDTSRNTGSKKSGTVCTYLFDCLELPGPQLYPRFCLGASCHSRPGSKSSDRRRRRDRKRRNKSTIIRDRQTKSIIMRKSPVLLRVEALTKKDHEKLFAKRAVSSLVLSATPLSCVRSAPRKKRAENGWSRNLLVARPQSMQIEA